MLKKRSMALVLSVACIINTMPINAQEMQAESSGVTIEDGVLEDTVYYDGAESEVNLDIETGNIIVSGESNGSEGTLSLSGDEAIINIENEHLPDENYVCEVNELSQESVDVNVYDQDGKLVDTYNSYDEIVDEAYEGQIALTAGQIAIMALGAVLLYVASVYIIQKSGITYIMADYFTKAIAKAKEAVRTKARSYYYPAVISGSVVYIDPHGVNLNAAAKLVKRDSSIYSYTATMAKKVITTAGYIPCNSNGVQNASELHNGAKQKGSYQFRHYHRGKMNSRGTISKSSNCHSLYGSASYIK